MVGHFSKTVFDAIGTFNSANASLIAVHTLIAGIAQKRNGFFLGLGKFLQGCTVHFFVQVQPFVGDSTCPKVFFWGSVVFHHIKKGSPTYWVLQDKATLLLNPAYATF